MKRKRAEMKHGPAVSRHALAQLWRRVLGGSRVEVTDDEGGAGRRGYLCAREDTEEQATKGSDFRPLSNVVSARYLYGP